MLNRYPLWKNALILMVLLLGALYAAPNLYPDDYAIQVSGASASVTTDERLQARVTKALDEAGLRYSGVELNDNNLLIRFADGDAQLRAKTVISRFPATG